MRGKRRKEAEAKRKIILLTIRIVDQQDPGDLPVIFPPAIRAASQVRKIIKPFFSFQHDPVRKAQRSRVPGSATARCPGSWFCKMRKRKDILQHICEK